MSEQKTKNNDPSFDVKLNVDSFRQALKSASFLVEELTINLNSEGLSFRVMDSSHVALIDCVIPNSCFEKYEVNNDSLIGLRLDSINKILKELDANETINLICSVAHPEIIKLRSKDMEFDLRTIEVSETDTPLPKISYNSELTVHKEGLPSFKKILKTFEAVSEYVNFSGDNQQFILSAKGDNGQSRSVIERGMPYYDLSHKEPLDVNYSQEYLTGFLKTLDKRGFKLECTTKMPLRIHVPLDNIGYMDYYSAPRVEN